MGKLERNLEKADLLILDELSYLSFNRHQSELLNLKLDGIYGFDKFEMVEPTVPAHAMS